MVKKVSLLTALFAMIISCNLAYSQAESEIDRNDSIPCCNECDSLFERVCSERPPEILPVFPGGDKEMMKFIAENIQWPAECAEMGIQGRVIVSFIIRETGEIICPKIRRSVHSALDREALRVINLMPNFTPASNNGIPVEMCYTLPIFFKL